MSVREATLEDADSIVSLLGEMGHETSSEEVSGRLAALASSSVDRIWVYEMDSKVVGFLSFHLWPKFYAQGNQGRVTALAVNSDFRKRGYGRRLLEQAERFGRDSGCARIEVTSYSHRTDSHQFYKTVGYTQVKSARFMKALTGDLR